MSDIYRFMLQWNGDTVDKVHAGNVLKSVGRRKSKLVVAAVCEYVKEHPESLTSGNCCKSAAEPLLTRGQVEEIVRDMIDARLANIAPIARSRAGLNNRDTVSKSDIDIMYQNLDLFTPSK